MMRNEDDKKEKGKKTRWEREERNRQKVRKEKDLNADEEVGIEMIKERKNINHEENEFGEKWENQQGDLKGNKKRMKRRRKVSR